MWSNNQRRIDNRIVSLTQPHVRPVRGKSGSPTKFGAKLSVSCAARYVGWKKLVGKVIMKVEILLVKWSPTKN